MPLEHNGAEETGDVEPFLPPVPNPMAGWGEPEKPLMARELLRALLGVDERDLDVPVEVLLFLKTPGEDHLTAHAFLAHWVATGDDDPAFTIAIGEDPGGD